MSTEPQLKLIAIVGMPGSGKSITGEFFRGKGIPVLRFGDQVDIGLKEQGLAQNPKNERSYREKLRLELGMAAMAIKIEPRIFAASKEHNVIALDGLYSWEEYVYLKSKFPQIQLLCIWAPPEVRYERLVHRPIRPLTIEEAKERDIAELEKLNKGGPIAIADNLIKNDGEESSFKNELEKMYKKLL